MLKRRGEGWQYIVRVNGRRHQFGPRSETVLGQPLSRKQAEEWAHRKHSELLETDKAAAIRAAKGLPNAVPMSELIARFRAEEKVTLAPGTQLAYEDTLKPVEEYFAGRGDPTIDEIQARDVKEYLSWRRVHRRDGKAPLSNRTLAKDRAVLHRLFNFADRMEWREGNPVARVQAPKGDGRDPVVLSNEEYDRLLDECSKAGKGQGPMLYLWALVLGETGARAYSEALWLRWEDADLAEGFVWIASGRDGHRTKSGKGRWTPMTPRLREAMREHFATYRLAVYHGRRSPWVFHHLHDRRNAKAGERVADMRNACDAAAKRAKLPEGFRRHDLRHRRVTVWLAEGRDVVKVKEAVGHADLRTTMGYQHLSREHLRSLVDEPAEKTAPDQRRGA